MPLTILLCYLIAVNLIASYIFWLDWRYAKHKLGAGEIPDRTFLTISLMGGAWGIVFMQSLLRHRIFRRRSFIKYRLALGIQLVVAGMYAAYPLTHI